MDSNKKLKKHHIKNQKSYYFYEITKIKDFDPNSILIYGKS